MVSKAVSPLKQKVSIITAGFGQNMVLTFVNTFILLYLTEYAGITSEGLLAVTAIMTAAKVFDAINDPFMGGIIDRTRTRWGKLRPYIIISALPVAITSALLFALPNSSETIKLVFFAICLFLWDIFYTMCDVPYWGLIGSAFPNTKERTGVISMVRGFGALALGLATLGGPAIAKILSFETETTAAGWTRAAFLISFIGMAMFTLAFFNTREKVSEEKEKTSMKELIGTLFKNKPLFLVLLGSIAGFGRTIIQAGGAVFALIVYNDESLFTLIGAAIIVGIIGASFLAPLLLKKFSSKSVMIWSTLVGAVFYFVMFLVGYSNIYLVTVFIFITGITVGIFMVVQTTMVADAVDHIEKKTGIRNDGISFSSLTFVSKMMGTLAILAFGIMLYFSKYEKGVEVTETMRNIVFVAVTIIPAISCLISVIPFAFYSLKDKNEKT